MDYSQTITLLLLSDDKNHFLWKYFFQLINKYWPSFNGQIVISSQTKSIIYKNEECAISEIKSSSWSERYIASLRKIKTPFVITFLDDFFIKSFVDDSFIQYCIEMLSNNKIKAINFSSCDSKKTRNFNKYFEAAPKFYQYLINAQVCIWKKEYLLKILRSYENPWEFEICGSFRAIFTSGIILFLKKEYLNKCFDYDYGFLIIRGKIDKQIGNYFKEKEGIDLFEKFDTFTSADIKKLSLHQRIQMILKCIKSIFVK